MNDSFASMRLAAIPAAALAAFSALLFVAPAPAQAFGCGQATVGYSQLVLANQDVAAYYRLDETIGPVACDLAGDADGTYVGDYSLGQLGALAADSDGAVTLSGLGAVRIDVSDDLTLPDALTVEAWVNPASIAASETVLRKDGEYLLRLANGS